MNEWIRFSEFDASNYRKVAKVKDFLDRNDLILSDDIELYVTASDEGEIVACGGISGKILKCVAVTPRLRGQRFVLRVVDALLNAAKRKGLKDLFLFSTPKNQSYFESNGFKLIESSGSEVILMENSDNLDIYKESLKKQKKDGAVIGSAIISDSTLGPKELILLENASYKCDWLHVFVVCEDGVHSTFKTNTLREELKKFKNITVHDNSEYMISKATFPTYFIKDQNHISQLHAELDLKIFKRHIAPMLGITHRFVGCESDLNEDYNSLMKKIFIRKDISPSIEVITI